MTRLARVALLLCLVVALGLTLSAESPVAALRDFFRVASRLVDRVTGDRVELSFSEAEVLANVALFVPLGLLLRPALPHVASSLLLLGAATASTAIEVAQYALLPARHPDLVDVLANTCGAAVGIVLADDLVRLVDRLRRWRAARRT